MNEKINDNDGLAARRIMELSLIENFLSNPDYEMPGIDFDFDTNLTDLAQKAQQTMIFLKEKVKALEQEVASLKSEKYSTPVYQHIYEEKLNPPAYQPSVEEIALAKARYVFDNEIWQTFHYLNMYIDSLGGKNIAFPYTKESIEKNAQQALSHWNSSLAKWDDDNELWDCFIDKDWFNTVFVNGLSDYHSGDCTAFACGCSRCQAENIFKIPNTVTWGKSEGSKMENAFIQDIKSKKELIK